MPVLSASILDDPREDVEALRDLLGTRAAPTKSAGPRSRRQEALAAMRGRSVATGTLAQSPAEVGPAPSNSV